MGRPAKHMDAEIRALYARYQAGATLAELARDSGISWQTIANSFHRLGFETRPGHNWAGSHQAMRDRQIIGLYLQKWAYADIGRRYGISKQRVHQILKRAGYPRKSGGNDELFVQTLDTDNDVC